MPLTVRPLAPDADRARLVALFRSFEAKAHQQRVQGLDPDHLATFFADGACRAAAHHPTWVAEQDDRLVGIAALQTEHWHTEHLGFPVGKVTQLMTAPACDDALAPLIDQIETTAREHGLHHLAARLDAHAFTGQKILAARGWYNVGVSVKLAARLDAQDASAALSVRPFQESDRARLLEIGTQSHDENHLYFDPHLPDDGAHAIFHRWVEKCLDGLAAQIWVAEHSGDVIGFVTILDPKSFNAAMNTRIAVLDYIVIDAAAQGGGLGSQLLAAVHREVARDFDQIELRTTATNFPALHLYARHAYRLIAADQALGRWLAGTHHHTSPGGT